MERRYWLWVTGPEYYLDDDGNDGEDLDPANGIDPGGWWTCNKDTREGDLALLWRKRPRSDIGYLIQASSDAYPIADAPDARPGWRYGCDYVMLYKFDNPLTINDLRENPYVQDWGAYRANFQGAAFRIPAGNWQTLRILLSERNNDYDDFLNKVLGETVVRPVLLEKEVEEELVKNLGILRDFGYDLELYVEPHDGKTGRQLGCVGNGGRIDLLCCDRTTRQFVVIELKIVRASERTFAQISNYMGWVQARLAGSTPVLGLVISRGHTVKFEACLNITDRISHLNLEQLGFQ